MTPRKLGHLGFYMAGGEGHHHTLRIAEEFSTLEIAELAELCREVIELGLCARDHGNLKAVPTELLGDREAEARLGSDNGDWACAESSGGC